MATVMNRKKLSFLTDAEFAQVEAYAVQKYNGLVICGGLHDRPKARLIEARNAALEHFAEKFDYEVH